MSIRTLGYKGDRFALPLMVLIVAASVAAGLATDKLPVYPLVLLGGGLLFLLLVWDFRVIVPLLIVLVPIGPKFPMSFGNLYLATAVVIVAYVAWVWRLPLSEQRLTFPREPVVLSLLVFIGVMLLASLQNLTTLVQNKLYFYRFIQFMMYTFLFAMILQLPFSRKSIRVLLVLALAMGFFEGVLGAYQWQTNPGMYVTGTFDYRHTNYSVYIVLITMLFLGVLVETRSRAILLACIGAIAVLLYALVFSFSRGAYVSLAVGIVVLLFMPIRRQRRLALVGAAAVLGVVIYLLLPEDVLLRAGGLFSTLTGKHVVLSFRSRLRMWGIAFSDFAQHPILGKGTWSYGLRDNFFIKVLAETGIVGLVAFLGVLYILLRREWQAIRSGTRSDFVRGVAIGLLPATVATLVVFQLSGDHFLTHRFMMNFWIVLAMVLKYCLGVGQYGRQNG
jgi:putative inorganic carbon (HCO3(-)) transporter